MRLPDFQVTFDLLFPQPQLLKKVFYFVKSLLLELHLPPMHFPLKLRERKAIIASSFVTSTLLRQKFLGISLGVLKEIHNIPQFRFIGSNLVNSIFLLFAVKDVLSHLIFLFIFLLFLCQIQLLHKNGVNQILPLVAYVKFPLNLDLVQYPPILQIPGIILVVQANPSHFLSLQPFPHLLLHFLTFALLPQFLSSMRDLYLVHLLEHLIVLLDFLSQKHNNRVVVDSELLEQVEEMGKPLLAK